MSRCGYEHKFPFDITMFKFTGNHDDKLKPNGYSSLLQQVSYATDMTRINPFIVKRNECVLPAVKLSKSVPKKFLQNITLGLCFSA